MTATVAAPAAAAASPHAKVGVLGASALVAGSMIGSGIYLLPATFGAIGSISLLGWLAALVAALGLAGVFALLGRVAPEARGLPDYVQAGLGRFFGVQTTLLYWTVGWFGSVGVALAAAGYAAYLVPALAPPATRLATTLVIIWASIAATWAGPRLVARVEGLTLALGLLPVLAVATLGWFWFNPGLYLASWNPTALSLGEAVKGSGLAAFWAFLGLECAAAAAGVVRDPRRNVPRATLGGVGLAALIYICASTVIMGLLPASALATSTAPFADATKAMIGVGGAGLIAACAFARTTGCMSGWTLVTVETSRSAADAGAFLPFLRTRPGERASAANLLAVGGLMSAATLATFSPSLGEQFGTVVNVTVLMCLYAYVMAAASLLRLSRTLSGGTRFAARATSVVAMACSAALIATAKPVELLGSLAPVVAAAALYLYLRRR